MARAASEGRAGSRRCQCQTDGRPCKPRTPAWMHPPDRRNRQGSRHRRANRRYRGDHPRQNCTNFRRRHTCSSRLPRTPTSRAPCSRRPPRRLRLLTHFRCRPKQPARVATAMARARAAARRCQCQTDGRPCKPRTPAWMHPPDRRNRQGSRHRRANRRYRGDHPRQNCTNFRRRHTCSSRLPRTPTSRAPCSRRPPPHSVQTGHAPPTWLPRQALRFANGRPKRARRQQALGQWQTAAAGCVH